MRNSEMLKFVADHLKTKEMCKHAVKKLSYLLTYVPDRYKTQQICHKTILENGGTFITIIKLYYCCTFFGNFSSLNRSRFIRGILSVHPTCFYNGASLSYFTFNCPVLVLSNIVNDDSSTVLVFGV